MIRINGRWHYEPEKGDLTMMEVCKLLRQAGREINFDDYRGRKEELMSLYYEQFGADPVPVPSHIMITVRDESGRII